MTKEKTAVALFVSFVTDDCKTTAECRLQRLTVVALHSECLTSLLGILLPLVDGVRDGDTFDDFDWLCFPAQYTCHALRMQPPLCVKPIRRQTSLQRGGGWTVKIRLVAPNDYPETSDIQMGVTDLQWVEGPLHQMKAANDRVVALREFEAAAYAQVAVLREYGKHVRV